MTLVALEGHVDTETIDALQERITTALSGGDDRIVVDLSAVTRPTSPEPLPSDVRITPAARRFSPPSGGAAIPIDRARARYALRIPGIG